MSAVVRIMIRETVNIRMATEQPYVAIQLVLATRSRPGIERSSSQAKQTVMHVRPQIPSITGLFVEPVSTPQLMGTEQRRGISRFAIRRLGMP
jgi:hypothetical protein